MLFRKELLIRAWDRGPLHLLKQSCSMVLATGPIIHVIGFQRKCQDNKRVQDSKGVAASFRNFDRWDQVPEPLKRELMEFSSRSEIGIDVMLGWGWRLWIGCRDNNLAIVGWSRSSVQSQDFFFPIPKSCVLIWYTETLPEHRGFGLFPLCLDYMVRTLGSEGTQCVYVTCAFYNQASRKGIEKAYFNLIGHGIMRAGSGRGLVWFPTHSTNVSSRH